MKKRCLFVVLLAGCTVTAAFAQGAAKSDNTELSQELDPVVVTATGTNKQMSRSPIPISVITAKALKQANITSFEEAMSKLTPNFSFLTNGGGTTMSMNGLPDSYVLVLENGKKLTGDDAYTRINMANVKRIEILNGAASALYGSDAIAGVINVITDDEVDRINISTQTRYSSKGRFTQLVNADLSVGKLNSFTSYQRQQADGWQLSPLVEVKDKKTGAVSLVPTDKEASTAFFSNSTSQRFTYDVNNRLSLYLRGSYYNSETDRPVTEYAYNMLHQTYAYGAGAEYRIKPQAVLTADFYSDNYTTNYGYIKKSGDFEAGSKEMRKRTRYDRADLKGVFGLGKRHHLSVGMEYVKEHLTSTSEKLSDIAMYTSSVYAQDEIDLYSNLQAVVGMRYTYHENYHSYATPHVALLYKLKRFNFRGSYAAGFRSPTLSQLYYTNTDTKKDLLTLANPALRPEKNDYFALNAEYAHPSFTLTVTGFLNQVRHMINYRTLTTDGKEEYGFTTVQQRSNIDRARIRGVNFSFNSYLGGGFTFNGGYSYIDARNVNTDAPIDKSLKHAANVAGLWAHTWNNYRLQVNLNGRIQGERYSQTWGYAPNFQLWNLNTTHTFTLNHFVLEPGAGIENIFNYRDNRPWNSNYATLTPGRALYASLVIRFNK